MLGITIDRGHTRDANGSKTKRPREEPNTPRIPRGKQGVTGKAAQYLAQLPHTTGTPAHPHDDLAHLITAWPSLTPAQRRAVMAIVRGVTP